MRGFLLWPLPLHAFDYLGELFGFISDIGILEDFAYFFLAQARKSLI